MRNLQPLTSQDNALCINLWTVQVNLLVSGYPAVDDRGCGNVNNRDRTRFCQVAGLRSRPVRDPGLPADLTLSDQHGMDLTRHIRDPALTVSRRGDVPERQIPAATAATQTAAPDVGAGSRRQVLATTTSAST
jgi:hypothetical protein